jgi:putative ABC transport system permease protein
MNSADLRLVLGLLILLAVAVGALGLAGVWHRRAVVTAALRAAVQLAIVAAALRGVFAAPLAVIPVIAVMFSVATWTSARRLRAHRGAARAVVLACGCGAVVAIGVVLGVPMLERNLRTLVAVAGIVIGGCMTASTLTGRRLADSLDRRRDEVEAWLSVGATPRQAVRELARDAAFDALVPALDQTRTVGLVTLPGAFVGALIGGVGAAGAARFQLAVLVALLCAESLTAVTLAWLLGAPATIPAPVMTTTR